ncbi:DUF6985 domain-containing protein [Anaeromicropila populeti]|uniref:DUF6985 domain-containing protein n=1 Tax=Anaeromicropila populeti TaxID=37658 RepID=A0A1I6JIL6_9FIRM|nr:hypothetical protein [Anaeromicropila populeti]SFR78470.1 hypothetical protein SAMN05661086_01696 [Anaeromicropila populeti]
MKRIEDKTFGTLEYDLYWEGSMKINMFEKEYSIILSIDGEDDGDFQDMQRQAFEKLKEKEQEIVSKMEESIFEYYQSICPERRSILDPDVIDEVVPVITEKKELYSMVWPSQLILREMEEDRELAFLFDCNWDIDLGVGIRMINEEIDEVGTQDIVL